MGRKLVLVIEEFSGLTRIYVMRDWCEMRGMNDT